jgi:hypothetical protein
MTKQATDRVVYLQEKYELIWNNNLEWYIRERYQLDKLIGGFSTDRDWGAEYEIRTAHLYLCALHIFQMFNPYPKIAGVVGEESYYRISRKVRKHDPKKERYGTTGWVTFRPLKERIEFSGYLVLGQCLKGYEDYMDFLSPHSCKKLLGITFVKGQPKQIEDFSQEAAEIRNQLTERYGTNPFERELIHTFSRKVSKLR